MQTLGWLQLIIQVDMFVMPCNQVFCAREWVRAPRVRACVCVSVSYIFSPLTYVSVTYMLRHVQPQHRVVRTSLPTVSLETGVDDDYGGLVERDGIDAREECLTHSSLRIQ